ncbi:Methyltransferase type 11 [Rhodospirillaceae bacterium LM-1]|nr:Methyltransferase type 11 [Rhodospirillaceae bacterium LM-1]
MPSETEAKSILTQLEALGLVRQDTIELLSPRTRDKADLPVYRDRLSRVIFIDNFYVGQEVYNSGAYRAAPPSSVRQVPPELADLVDTDRRVEKYRHFCVGKRICDFGCGSGGFLRRMVGVAKEAVGIELQADYASRLEADGIPCFSTLSEAKEQFDAVFLFHSFEHFPDPLAILREIKAALKNEGVGKLVIEVPHANDFLISQLDCQEFLDFTLWSQHLILHTRESLSVFLREAGFKSICIEGVQRFGLSNHLHWLRRGKPGGHTGILSTLETPALTLAYADALARIDATDTLVAVAST